MTIVEILAGESRNVEFKEKLPVCGNRSSSVGRWIFG